MMSLGTLLVKHGWISKQQLGLAISKQREIGGRLGTCLLEMGAISEDLLNRSLAEQQGVPSADAEDLREIEPKVARLLPAPIAIRYRAIPFRATQSDVDIAMLEVDNLWLQDELSFIVGRRLNVYIANEARIVDALAKYYRAPCSDRFTKLLMRLNQERDARLQGERHPESRLFEADIDEATEISQSTTSTTQPRTAARQVGPLEARAAAAIPEIPSPLERQPTESRPTEPNPVELSAVQDPSIDPHRSIPVTVEQLASFGARPGSSQAGRSGQFPQDVYLRDTTAREVESLEEIEVAIDTTADPEEVGRLLLAALSQLMTRVVLFKVTPGQVLGWLAEGPGLNRERLQQFAVTFDQPSIFLNLRSGGSFFLGSLPEMPAHLELMKCWHKDLADECGVFPVRIRERLVALVYGDCGPLGMADLDIDRVRSLCGVAARALERCIVERKKRQHQPVE